VGARTTLSFVLLTLTAATPQPTPYCPASGLDPLAGEYLAVAVSLEDLGIKTGNARAKLLSTTLMEVRAAGPDLTIMERHTAPVCMGERGRGGEGGP
jgi:hypothetical protein